jgi:ribonuclease VapC
MSAANYLEAAIVVDAKRNPLLSRRFDDLVAQTGIAVEPVDRDQAEIARAAYRDYGKGSGHPAGPNYGDSFAYALARAASRSCSRATTSRRRTSPSPDPRPRGGLV